MHEIDRLQSSRYEQSSREGWWSSSVRELDQVPHAYLVCIVDDVFVEVQVVVRGGAALVQGIDGGTQGNSHAWNRWAGLGWNNKI